MFEEIENKLYSFERKYKMNPIKRASSDSERSASVSSTDSENDVDSNHPKEVNTIISKVEFAVKDTMDKGIEKVAPAVKQAANYTRKSINKGIQLVAPVAQKVGESSRGTINRKADRIISATTRKSVHSGKDAVTPTIINAVEATKDTLHKGVAKATPVVQRAAEGTRKTFALGVDKATPIVKKAADTTRGTFYKATDKERSVTVADAESTSSHESIKSLSPKSSSEGTKK